MIRELRNDQTLMVNDSDKSAPDKLREYDYTVDKLFASGGQQVELVWLEDTTDHEAEIANRFELKYDAENRAFSFREDQGKNAGKVRDEQTILHKNGIEAVSQLYDDVVYNSVYVPRQLKKQR